MSDLLQPTDEPAIIAVLQNPQEYPAEIRQAAIAHFYTAHIGLITNYYQRQFEIAKEDAEDLAHELLIIIIYTKIIQYQPGALDGWLVRVARNWYLNQQRRDRRTIPIGAGDDDDESEVPPSEQMMDRAAGRYPGFLSAHQRMAQEGLSNIEVVDLIDQYITQAKLTKPEADVAWLILYYELKPSEIAALMPNQTAANISRIWWNAKQKLKGVSLE